MFHSLKYQVLSILRIIQQVSEKHAAGDIDAQRLSQAVRLMNMTLLNTRNAIENIYYSVILKPTLQRELAAKRRSDAGAGVIVPAASLPCALYILHTRSASNSSGVGSRPPSCSVRKATISS